MTAKRTAVAPSVRDQGRVLVIEDEKNIAELIRYNLEREGFQVVVAQNGEEGLRVIEQHRPDLVLLDLLLPRLDGLEVCRRLRQHEATRLTPIIILTAKASEADKVSGLELGADDYVTKPFSPRELIARIRAALRRRSSGRAELTATSRIGTLEVDWERHVVHVKDAPVRLTAKEFRLLRVLVEARGRVLSREALLERVWGYDPSLEIETRTVDFHISRLRQKLRTEAYRLMTIPGAGYRFLSEGA